MARVKKVGKDSKSLVNVVKDTSINENDIVNAMLDPNISAASDIISKMFESTDDLKEKLLKEVVDRLFDRESLLMISRYDNTLAFYIVKHLIINNFYIEYYRNIKFKATIVGIETPPYYERATDIVYPTENDIVLNCYQRFIDELSMVTISFKGLGRSELVNIIESMQRKIREDEMKAVNTIRKT